MKDYKTLEEARNKHPFLGKYEWEMVKIDNKDVILSGTSLAYEPIIELPLYAMMDEFDRAFKGLDIMTEDDINPLRDLILDYLMGKGFVFEEVSDEY